MALWSFILCTVSKFKNHYLVIFLLVNRTFLHQDMMINYIRQDGIWSTDQKFWGLLGNHLITVVLISIQTGMVALGSHLWINHEHTPNKTLWNIKYIFLIVKCKQYIFIQTELSLHFICSWFHKNGIYFVRDDTKAVNYLCFILRITL